MQHAIQRDKGKGNTKGIIRNNKIEFILTYVSLDCLNDPVIVREKKIENKKLENKQKAPQINLESLKIACRINEKISHKKHHSVTAEQIY